MATTTKTILDKTKRISIASMRAMLYRFDKETCKEIINKAPKQCIIARWSVTPCNGKTHYYLKPERYCSNALEIYCCSENKKYFVFEGTTVYNNKVTENVSDGTIHIDESIHDYGYEGSNYITPNSVYKYVGYFLGMFIDPCWGDCYTIIKKSEELESKERLKTLKKRTEIDAEIREMVKKSKFNSMRYYPIGVYKR